MRRLLVLSVLCLLATAAVVRAQSVTPPVIEYPTATEGSFEVANNSLSTLYATIEPKSFTIGPDGSVRFTALSPDVHLELSTTSIKLPPQQKRTVYYKASAAQYPAWFCIYTDLTARPQPGKMSISLDLPHTVYLLGKNHAYKQDIATTNIAVSGGKLTGVIENHSRAVVRVQDLRAGSHHAEDAGFPLLPGSTRSFSIDMAGDRASQIVARMSNFELKFPVPGE